MARVAENPAAIMLGFDHEDFGFCHENVVNLRRPALSFKCHVVEEEVRQLQTIAHGLSHQGFAEVAPEPKDPTSEHTKHQPREKRKKNQCCGG